MNHKGPRVLSGPCDGFAASFSSRLVCRAKCGQGWCRRGNLLRLTYLAVANAFAALRLPPMSDRDKDAEILALRHQLVVLQRQLGPARVGRRKVGADPPRRDRPSARARAVCGTTRRRARRFGPGPTRRPLPSVRRWSTLFQHVQQAIERRLGQLAHTAHTIVA